MAKTTGRREFIHAAGFGGAGLLAASQALAAAGVQTSARPASQPAAARTMGARFRELLHRGEPFEAVAAYDVFTARMVELMGFPALFMGGSLVGDFYAEPVWMASLAERIDYVRHIAELVDIPTLADMDDGGDPNAEWIRVFRYCRADAPSRLRRPGRLAAALIIPGEQGKSRNGNGPIIGPENVHSVRSAYGEEHRSS